ncbi:flagellar biosynthesis protein [Piscinibacter koreensis]|uniref:Flagellar biosynthesis protein n=1 Tax=Piscinibacter koreensis TaxID=2742824 RepID=A0A7Y6NMR9_9BURK|nr:flagellar biosynthesis protein [Schlegelella koreensis]NUZ05954.1 flagellar biosynthesis protein [Schlegelella koreensis]
MSFSRPVPLDQAAGLRRLFANSQAQARIVPVVANPHVGSGGALLERLCTAFGEHGLHTLVVDAGERAGTPNELALIDLAACVERLSKHVSYLAARGLPLRYVDAAGSTQAFVSQVIEAAPRCNVILLHAGASDLCRMLQRRPDPEPVCPLLLADDHPSSVTHAFAAMKLLTQRASWVVFDLLLGAATSSPRADRIAAQLATCADDFLGAVLRSSARVDPALPATAAPPDALRRLVRTRIEPAFDLSTPRPAAFETSLHGPLDVAPARTSNWAST